jgi:hypothetical protein
VGGRGVESTIFETSRHSVVGTIFILEQKSASHMKAVIFTLLCGVPVIITAKNFVTYVYR